MRLPNPLSARSPYTMYSASRSLSGSSLYASISPAAGAFIPAEFSHSASAYTQVFVANEDGASVVSSSFDDPCVPSDGDDAFYSGVMSKGDMFAVERPEGAAPLFFYSPEKYDCSNGMVGALNPSTTESLSAYLEAARVYARPGIAPSSPAAYGGTLTPLNPNVQAIAAADGSYTFSSTSSALPDQSGSDVVFASTLPPGVVAGIAIAAVVVLGIALGAGWWVWSEYVARREKAQDVEGTPENTTPSPDATTPSAPGSTASTPPTRTQDTLGRAFVDVRGPGFEDDEDEDDEYHGSGDLADEKMAHTVRWGRASVEKVAIGTMSIRQSGSF